MDTHGSAPCIDCHGGNPQADTRALAHVGLVPDPTVTAAAATCGKAGCHPGITTQAANSLHVNLAGIRHSLEVRGGGGALGTELQTGFTNHCGRCHSSCGDCHISVPAAAGGGLLAKHLFRKTPSTTLVCTACHGSRVGDEYRGNNSGFPADTHYNRGLQCTACHTGAEMHGEGAAGVTHRYQVTSAPRCDNASCHPDDAAFRTVSAHGLHRETGGGLKLACQVCHSTSYKNCSTCHVQLDVNGKPVFEVNAPSHESLMTFKIGRNPAPDALHPHKWVVVRHVPAAPDNYDAYGANLQPTFDAAPTWRLATPHNIQRTTPQSAGCTASCHGQRELFLAPTDLQPYETTANQGVVVPDDQLP